MDEETSIFKQPLFNKLKWFGVFIVIYLFGAGGVLALSGDKSSHTLEMIIDAFICVSGMVFWMIFFAQFVLPVNKLRDRLKVTERLVTYVMGGHGAAIFIENGFTRMREGEDKKKGRGVVWLDSASAASLTGRKTRIVGPGIHFTTKHENVAATADLHTLTQSIGPNDNDEPFTIQESDPNFKAVKERSNLTNAITRNGIQVCAIITINFRIKSTPGEGNTRFGFNEQNTEAAIRESIVRDTKTEHPVWNTLPGKMAADLWREYLGKFRLDELFELNENRPDTTIILINEMIRKRLTKPRVEILDEYGHVVLENKKRENEYRALLKDNNIEAAEKLLKKAESSEYIKLSEMGLEVKSVLIKKLFFMPDIEEQLISQWETRWLKNAQQEREQVELDRKIWESTGQQAGLKEFAIDSSRELAQKTTASPAQTLELLVHSTFRGAQKNPNLVKHLNNELRDLSEIFAWLREQQGPKQ